MPSFGGPAEAWREGGPARCDSKSTSADGGDLPPVRMVVDPLSIFNGVVVDSATTRDDERHEPQSLLVSTGRPAASRRRRRPLAEADDHGARTGVGFAAGVAMDPGPPRALHGEQRRRGPLVVFDYDARGNVTPKRLLYVPTVVGDRLRAQARRDGAVGADAEHVCRLQREAKKVRRAGPIRARAEDTNGGPARD